jgi:hypothetical protein
MISAVLSEHEAGHRHGGAGERVEQRDHHRHVGAADRQHHGHAERAGAASSRRSMRGRRPRPTGET